MIRRAGAWAKPWEGGASASVEISTHESECLLTGNDPWTLQAHTSCLFALSQIVHIDPDHFKKLMPEWGGYLERSEPAGDLTHRESGYLQEMCF